MHVPEDSIPLLKRSARLAAETLDHITPRVVPGMSTGELDRLCHRFILDQGGESASLGYHGFPKAICTSRNSVVCHGIPRDDEFLQSGDIVNLDVGVVLDGWYGDTSRSFLVGHEGRRAKSLVDASRDALEAAIGVVRPGTTLGEVGRAIEVLATSRGYSVVREYTGHGIGPVYHALPLVYHWDTGDSTVLEPGMCFTIEPMINEGLPDVYTMEDGWTVKTVDDFWSAQFEHMVLVTEHGCEVLTR